MCRDARTRLTRPDDFREPRGWATPSGWDAPVVYLKEYPPVDIGPRGYPYYVCARCAAPLQVLPRSSTAGVMLVCVYGYGQRFWIDDDRDEAAAH
jgi:hypothetical protein